MAQGKEPQSESVVASTEANGSPRSRILQAALQLFVEQGYFNTNIPDISKRSRCSVGSIYHHFLNKEEIAEQLYRDGITQFRKALHEGIDPSADLKTTIRHLVISFLTFSEENVLLARYLWLARHSEFLSSKLHRPTMVGFDELGRKLTKLIKQGIRSKQLPPMKAEIIWNIVFGTALSFIRDWLEGYTSSTPAQVANVLADACWGALQGAKA